MRPTRVGTTHLISRIANVNSGSSTRLNLRSQVPQQGLITGSNVGKKIEMQMIFQTMISPEGLRVGGGL
ncbi:uncharacterized protein CC84DRAFT_1158609 [Paraphaeosphaeria sporulosa]|uniref:Uncharacterized protein n=1 Tax=Paraphaeosphaeria sporulosa TaxID=1460663 RepID=A0A177BTQ9_9PLEO|nr:uncharacterized protein CC84DRAFT_1158609 [Paraphaeosphaeria sporulosa]OAF98555.1 hypothetical protein CC84DRAFT_1158609 [Paraphaeosphaeria sporulosa]